MTKETKGITINSAEDETDETIKKLQEDLWARSKENGVILRGEELSLWIQGWKKGREGC